MTQLDIQADRGTQLVLASDQTLRFDEARLRLERASLFLTAQNAGNEHWGQAAMLAIAACATRMFRGGVFVDPALTQPLRVGQRWPTTLAKALIDAGCRAETPPGTALRLHVGADSTEGQAQLYCWADGWTAVVSPDASKIVPKHGNALSGALCGAMAVTEAFRKVVLNDLLACRRSQSFALWPDSEETAITYLPSALWLIGLGNLGQATLFTLGLLPFDDTSEVKLLLQDDDVAGPENLPVQVLTRYDWIGKRKARSAAAWAEARGFSTTLCERRFRAGDGPGAEEPRIALVGIDNLEGRRHIAAAGFDFVADAGLGATGPEAFDIRLHAFPGARTPARAWPEPAPVAPGELPAAYQALVDEGRLDDCGAMTIAGKSIGVPATALAAAALQLTQVCRHIATGGRYSDLIDVSLRNTGKAVIHDFERPDLIRLGFRRSAEVKGPI